VYLALCHKSTTSGIDKVNTSDLWPQLDLGEESKKDSARLAPPLLFLFAGTPEVRAAW